MNREFLADRNIGVNPGDLILIIGALNVQMERAEGGVVKVYEHLLAKLNKHLQLALMGDFDGEVAQETSDA